MSDMYKENWIGDRLNITYTYCNGMVESFFIDDIITIKTVKIVSNDSKYELKIGLKHGFDIIVNYKEIDTLLNEFRYLKKTLKIYYEYLTKPKEIEI